MKPSELLTGLIKTKNSLERVVGVLPGIWAEWALNCTFSFLQDHSVLFLYSFQTRPWSTHPPIQ